MFIWIKQVQPFWELLRPVPWSQGEAHHDLGSVFLKGTALTP